MDKCLLCKVNNADKTGSHIVPHFLMKMIDNVVGKTGRDVELGFVIEPFETHSYFGRRVQPEKLEETFGELSDEDIEQKKKLPLVVDYLFCSTCEKRLSIIESEYSKTLTKYSDKKYNSGVSSELGLLFWMSVIWRVSVNNTSGQRLKKGENESIRRILVRSMTDSIETIDFENMKNLSDLKRIGYRLIRCHNYTIDSTSLMLFHPEFDKPYSLLLGEYILLFSLKNNFIHYKTRDFFGLKDDVFLATVNQVNANESIFPISIEKMKQIHDGIINKIKSIRLKFIDEFLDRLHIELGGAGKEMPINIKREVLEEVTSESKKTGRKYTLQDLRDSTYKVLKKYTT
jgi:hypothetical protein